VLCTLPVTSTASLGLVLLIPNLLFELSQCKFVGVNTPLVPFPTITLLAVNVPVFVPPLETATYCSDVIVLASLQYVL